MTLVLVFMSLPGPTVVAPPSARQPYLEILHDDDSLPSREVEDLLSEHPEVSRKRSGSLGGLSRLSFRGSRSLQNQMELDGLPLASGFHGLQAWRLLEPALIRRLRIDPGGSGSGLSPLGGSVDLKTTGQKEGPWLALSYGSEDQRQLAFGHRGPKLRLGASLSAETGNFRFFDDRGTFFTPKDDRWVHRQNNQRQRVNLLLALDQPHFTTALFLADLAGGIPGPGHRQSKEVTENLNLMRWQMSRRFKRQRYQIYAAKRQELQNDPQGELSPQSGSSSQSKQEQLGLRWRGSKNLNGWQIKSRLGAQVDRFSRNLDAGWSRQLDIDLSSARGRALLFWFAAQQRKSTWKGQSLDRLAWTPGLAIGIPGSGLSLRLQSMARIPTALELYGQNFRLQGNPSLKSERGVGGDLNWHRNPWRFSLYGRHLYDLVEWDQNAQFSSRARNRAQAQVIGLSLLFRSRQFQLGYRLQQTWAYDSKTDSQADRLTGEPVHRLRLQWRRSWQPYDMSLRWDLNDRFYLDRANLRPVAPLSLVDLSLGYRPSPQGPRFYVAIKNIFDQRQSAVEMLPSQQRLDLALADQFGYPLPGRQWNIGMEVRP